MFKIDSFYWTIICKYYFFAVYYDQFQPVSFTAILIQTASGLLVLTTLLIHFYGISNDSAPPTVSQIITCLALFNHLTIALFIFPLTVPVVLSAIVSTKRLCEFLQLTQVKPKNMGIQTIARIISRSDTHSDLIEDRCSLISADGVSEDARSEKVETLLPNRSRVFISKDPWAVKIGKLRIKGVEKKLLNFEIQIPKRKTFKLPCLFAVFISFLSPQTASL